MSPAVSWASLPNTSTLRQRCKPRGHVGLAVFSRSFALSVYFVPFTVGEMPLLAISEEQAAAAIAAMNDALDSLLVANDIPRDVRAVLGHVGVRRLPNLANYESTEERFREAMGKDLGIEPVDAGSRILLSNLIESWKSSRNRLKVKDDEDAVARAQGRPAPLAVDSFVAMRRAWEKLHGERTDAGFPSKFYINRRLRQLETGELKPERLSEVTSVREGGDEDDDRELDLVITGSSFRATRKYVSVPLPGGWDTEAFRQRIVLMKIHWDIAVAQSTNKRAFVDYDCEAWTRHAEYLLGEEIYGYRACGLRLSWEDFLEYEWTIRQAALKRVNRGEASLTVALTEALTDPSLKQLHFTLPLTTKGRKDGGPSTSAKGQGRGEESRRPSADKRLEQEVKRLRTEVQNLRNSASSSSGSMRAVEAPPPPQTTPRKGKSKGKGKSDDPLVAELRHLRQTERLFNNLPNGGGLICYYYQLGRCNNGKQCKFHHVCMRCLGEGHTVLEKNKCKSAAISK